MDNFKYIKVFDRYAEDLDDKFDDSLVLEYVNIDGTPIFKILYDPSVKIDKLMKHLPAEWKNLESEGKIKLDIREFSEDSQEHHLSQKVMETMKQNGSYQKLMTRLDFLK